MYGKPAITCNKCHVFLYGSKAITYLKCYTLSDYRASSMSHHTAPTPPLQAALTPLCMAAVPSPI
jgi:hypothetical protein